MPACRHTPRWCRRTSILIRDYRTSKKHNAYSQQPLHKHCPTSRRRKPEHIPDSGWCCLMCLAHVPHLIFQYGAPLLPLSRGVDCCDDQVWDSGAIGSDPKVQGHHTAFGTPHCASTGQEPYCGSISGSSAAGCDRPGLMISIQFCNYSSTECCVVLRCGI